MDSTDPIPSPWVQSFQDNFGRVIRITVNFNNTTRVISGATVFRDVSCQWSRIYIDSPSSTDKVFQVVAGTTNLTANQLSTRGLSTIEDVLALQITAGP